MLGQIANYCPVIARNTIVKSSVSISSIWQTIRLHYGFQSSGAHFLDLCDIHLQPEERPEDLYQRLSAFVEDNLLKQNGGITHHGEAIGEDEELTPTLENIIILTWLRLIHPDLPKLVKQRYGTELRSRTLASIKPEISQALNSLLDEIHSSEDAKVMRTATSRANNFTQRSNFGPRIQQTSNKRRYQSTSKTCPLCHTAGRPSDNHFLSECSYLPDQDRKYMAKARQIASILDESEDEDGQSPHTDTVSTPPVTASSVNNASVNRVSVRQSPYMNAFYGHNVICLTLDSGATGNMISQTTARRLGIAVTKSSQSAHQADGSSPLHIVGETRVTLSRDNKDFIFEGLVVENLDVELLAGTPFMEVNDVAVRPAKRQITLGDGTTFQYGNQETHSSHHTVRRAHVLRAPKSPTTIWPGDFIELSLPDDLIHSDDTFAVEPRLTGDLFKDHKVWPAPDIVSSVSGKIRIPNDTKEPLVLKKHEHFCQVQQVFTIPNSETEMVDSQSESIPLRQSTTTCKVNCSEQVRIDPDNQFSPDTRNSFHALIKEYDDVFNPHVHGYNGKSGPFKAVVNMGPVQPPQRKGRVPQYSRDKLVELQDKFDELENIGVFVKPEDVGISVEYLNPSFLVKKSNGGFRLVTAFTDVGRYSKPQPSLMPDVDSTLRQIAAWKYIITTDLTNAFYQIPLSRGSMKYCGVATPFRGVRVYVRSAMGMPGSETALEELMCRVLGHLLKEGSVAKLADDLYCGGNTVDELLNNWRRVLQALQFNGLKLSAAKTTVGPSSVTILGWIWKNGSIQASPHRISTLSSCTRPSTVKGLRSFIGAYKVLARVIPGCAGLLGPLDTLQAGRPSAERKVWSEVLICAFGNAQSALSSHKTIVLPRRDDQLWIVTDGAVKNHGIGATLYITRNNSTLLAGFFSAKLRQRQMTWLPCGIEALSIAVATKHFSPYLVQSSLQACILTDSKPCVQAYEKLCRGEFSASPRVSTFLSTVSRYQASVRHLSGSANIPSDFASRNASKCDEPLCQICSFIRQTEDCTVRGTSVQDIMSGKSKLPYTNRNAWLAIQSECSDLRRTHAHLIQGTRPSKKQTDVKDVKRYLQSVTIAKDGVLVIQRNEPLVTIRECIVIPQQVLDGLLTAMHIQLNHPSAHQLKLVVNRYFYALDMDQAITKVSSGCYHCTSLQQVPHTVVAQSSTDPPEIIGAAFAADVIKRERQLILVLRECITSFTCTCAIENEQKGTLREALIRLSVEMRPLDGPPAVIRTDPAPGFKALVQDDLLRSQRLCIEIGRIKNKNKNPVAERAIQELELELLKIDPLGGSVTPITLAIATAQLNSRIRSRGLSAREMWTQRDQFNNHQIPVGDRKLILDQHHQRTTNHLHSEMSKAHIPSLPTPNISIGDLVYLHADRNKSRSRDRYLVVVNDGEWCNIQKFVGSQLRSTSYRVKKSECFRVPCQHEQSSGLPQQYVCDESSDGEIDTVPQRTEPPTLPIVPPVLNEPYHDQDILVNPPEHPPLDNQDSLLENVSDNDIVNTDDTGDTVYSTPVNAQRRSIRARRPPQHLNDYVTDF
ncbi:uncharacterized protein [Haliotis cracherodii]|uniref:uncharacterized protein n=1 Tax=Haliotis cracherodii TaxID=6455 RepID=UPI0039E7E142